MSEIHDVLSDVVSERASTFGDTIKNLTSGATFAAEIETNLDPFTLTSELANDPREKVRLHVFDDSAAAKLNVNDLIEFFSAGVKCRFKLVSGHVSQASIMNQFLAIQVVDGKDAQ